jgi:hypothetical protein
MKPHKQQLPDVAERLQLQLQEVTASSRESAARAAPAERRQATLRRVLLDQLAGEVRQESDATLH